VRGQKTFDASEKAVFAIENDTFGQVPMQCEVVGLS
jgi:hypothetical protein